MTIVRLKGVGVESSEEKEGAGRKKAGGKVIGLMREGRTQVQPVHVHVINVPG